jgi:predicted permease
MNIPLERIEGQQNPPGRRFLESVRWFAVTPQFSDTLRIKVTRGRGFNNRDSVSSPPVAIVNETFVKKHFPNENPLGRRISVGWNFLGSEYAEQPREIVGVMADIHDRRLQLPPRPSVFVPLTQVGDAVSRHVNAMVPLNLIARTNVNPLSVSQALVKQVELLDPLLPVYQVKTMENVMDDTISSQHFVVGMLGGFALVAITLACLGIYGVMSYVVTQRTREIGVRMALGASPGSLFRSVIGEGLLLATVGLAAGSACAWGLTRILESLLFGVASRDLRTFALAPLLLVLVALAACYIPARRALKIEPMAALRQE